MTAVQPRVGERDSTPVDLTAIWRPTALFVASRALVLFALVVAGAAHGNLSMRNAMTPWDSGFYFRIANHGYPSRVPHGASVLAFFPGFPLAIRGAGDLFRLDAYGASTIVVFVFGLVAAILVWYLTRELADPDAADRATALFAFAPGSFVLSMAYSDAVFVCFAVACCWALIRRRWILAGVLGALGAVARPDGLALALAAACAAYVAYRDRHDLGALVAVPLAACGFVAVQLYFWAHTGDPFAFFTAERRGWHHGFSTLGTGRLNDMRSVWRTIVHGGNPDWNHVTSLAGLIVFVSLLVLLIRWRPPLELVGMSVGLGFFAFTAVQVGFRPRTLMAAFPLSIVLGVKLRRGPWFAVALATSAALLVLLAIVTVTTRYVTP